MKEIKWLETNQIQISKPRGTKKVTGTRFATILGLNPWSTPFEMWCAITKTYEKPFEDTIYTIAGKTIEPKQADFLKNMGLDIKTPTDIYGKDYFNKTFGDFFPKNKHLGGMWDFLGIDENGEVDTVYEMKTTKRVEDWANDVPEYYALQAALYAYLLGVDDVVMVASFLEDSDYDNPDKFECSVDNTILHEFKVSERYPNFKQLVDEVEEWWKTYVSSGISPIFDEKKDAEILKALRTNSVNPLSDVNLLIKEAEDLTTKIENIKASYRNDEKRLKEVTSQIKDIAISNFRDGDTKVEINGNTRVFTISKTTSDKFDEEAFKAAYPELHAQFVKPSESYRIANKLIK